MTDLNMIRTIIFIDFFVLFCSLRLV
jgi:hypothetical protein